MNFQQRKEVLVQMGRLTRVFGSSGQWPGYESGITESEFDQFSQLITTVHQHNGWFVESDVRKALDAWGQALTPSNIDQWLSPYHISDSNPSPARVGVIGAGNLPLVALHDIITVFISGHKAVVKLSKDDKLLIPALFGLLSSLFKELPQQIEFAENRLENTTAVIATGSNNSSRYFEYYFRSIPHITRKNRNSVAILTGQESPGELESLGHDIFDYFGLGCRNVTKIYVPAGYDFQQFFEAIYPFGSIINHHKYANNYDYNKAVWLLNRESLLDNNFILLKEDTRIASPTASLYYEFYTDRDLVIKQLAAVSDQLQCIVGDGYLPFGSAQCPMLWDYADGVDTISFLDQLRSGKN
jgi:hypothetical protein